jgi:uncharacterized protein (TIGR02284 family)
MVANVSQLMTRGVRKLAPSDTVAFAAQAMDELNIGAVPVCDGEKLVGMITDRDIVLRSVAQTRPLDTPVSEIMSGDVVSCFEDEAAEGAIDKMEHYQIRRLPVVDHEQFLVGMLSLGDLSAKGDIQKAGHALNIISQPAEPSLAGISTVTDDKDIVAAADRNREPPLAGQAGAHPVGIGLGAAGGGAAGAAMGAAAGGPVGAIVGMAAGAVAGGFGGKAVAEVVDPAAEDAYWRENYEREPYYQAGRSYDDYRPAYELGWSRRAAGEAEFALVEANLPREWETRSGSSALDWREAREAARAAWDRAGRAYDDERVGGGIGSGDVLTNAETIDVLNELLKNSRDGEYGFRTCAEEVKASKLMAAFNDRAEECRRAAEELVQLIARLGGSPAEGGTASGAMHRGWVHVKGAVGANSELSMLEECERGEDAAVARYRKALMQNLPAEVRSLVERQAQGAQRNHDQIRDLRDQARRVRQ